MTTAAPKLRQSPFWMPIRGPIPTPIDTPGNECVQVVCCLRPTTILQTVFAAAQLAALRRVDTPEPDADSMNFQCVAINDAGLTSNIIGSRVA